MTESKKIPQINGMYFLGTLLVILGHSHTSDWSAFGGTFFEDLIVFIYHFHMPAFFFVAGFLFLNSCSLERLGLRKWAGKKIARLMTPYVVLSLVVMLPKYFFEHHSMSGFSWYLVEAIFAPRVGVWGHFWFLPVLLLCYLIFGLWHKYCFQRKSAAVLMVTVGVTVVIWVLPVNTMWFGLADLKASLVFFAAGMLAYRLWKQQPERAVSTGARWAVMAVELGVSIALHVFCAHQPALMLALAFMMIGCLWQLACLIGERKLVSWISGHNFTIYIYSWPVQAAVMVLCGVLGLSWQVTGEAMFAAGLGGPALLAAVYEHVRCIHNHFFDLVLGIK